MTLSIFGGNYIPNICYENHNMPKSVPRFGTIWLTHRFEEGAKEPKSRHIIINACRNVIKSTAMNRPAVDFYFIGHQRKTLSFRAGRRASHRRSGPISPVAKTAAEAVKIYTTVRQNG